MLSIAALVTSIMGPVVWMCAPKKDRVLLVGALVFFFVPMISVILGLIISLSIIRGDPQRFDPLVSSRTEFIADVTAVGIKKAESPMLFSDKTECWYTTRTQDNIGNNILETIPVTRNHVAHASSTSAQQLIIQVDYETRERRSLNIVTWLYPFPSSTIHEKPVRCTIIQPQEANLDLYPTDSPPILEGWQNFYEVS